VQITQSAVFYAIPYVRNEIGISYGSTVLTVGLEHQPELPNPAAGQVTIAVRIPAGSICEGLVAVGTNGTTELGWTPSAGNPLTKVTDTDTWYSITLTYAADMAVKVIAVPQTGIESTTWSTQWGMNTDDVTNVTFLEEPTTAVLTTENSGEVKLTTLSDQDVVYIDVAAWKSAPCAPPVPGGTGTFTFTPACELPENAVVIFTGNFDENGWGDSTRQMIRQANGSYTWTGAYPAGFQMKVIVDGSWMSGQNVVFDGTTFSFTGTGDFCPVP
ncbi:MAG: hypothetical protein KA995_05875, partial [Paludibacteraceae bacterium]|nr:hypothetical protein [Paludibacteraceae bacterium]